MTDESPVPHSFGNGHICRAVGLRILLAAVLSPLLIAALAGCRGGPAPAAIARDARQPVVGSWSEPVKGMSGRVRMAFEPFGSGGRYAISIELRNSNAGPVAVKAHFWNVGVGVLDSSGNPLAQSSYPMSGPLLQPEWVEIPGNTSLAYRVDMTTVGVPTTCALVAVGWGMWGLKEGKYTLKAKMTCVKQEGPANQWMGELVFPPVDFTVALERDRREAAAHPRLYSDAKAEEFTRALDRAIIAARKGKGGQEALEGEKLREAIGLDVWNLQGLGGAGYGRASVRKWRLSPSYTVGQAFDGYFENGAGLMITRREIPAPLLFPETIIGRPKHQWLYVWPHGLAPERIAGYETIVGPNLPKKKPNWGKAVVYRTQDKTCEIEVSFQRDYRMPREAQWSEPMYIFEDHGKVELGNITAGSAPLRAENPSSVAMVFRAGDTVCWVEGKRKREGADVRKHVMAVGTAVLRQLQNVKKTGDSRRQAPGSRRRAPGTSLKLARRRRAGASTC